VGGIGEDLLRLLGERELGGGGDAVDEETVAFDLPADLLRLDVEAGKDLFDDLFPLAEDAQEDVLGLDDARAELRCFISGEEKSAASFLVVLFEHDLGPSVLLLLLEPRSCHPAFFIANGAPGSGMHHNVA
jgi:hypothetical protein